MRNEAERNIIEKAELLELSFVPIPAQPEAIGLWKDIGASIELFDFVIQNSTKEVGQDDEKKEATLDEVMKRLDGMDSKIKTLLDDKSDKGWEDDDLHEQKELLQIIARSANGALRNIKSKIKAK